MEVTVRVLRSVFIVISRVMCVATALNFDTEARHLIREDRIHGRRGRLHRTGPVLLAILPIGVEVAIGVPVRP